MVVLMAVVVKGRVAEVREAVARAAVRGSAAMEVAVRAAVRVLASRKSRYPSLRNDPSLAK